MALAALPAAGAAAQRPPAGPQVLEDAAKELAALDVSLKRTFARAEDAKDEKDVEKLVCVDEKLTAMKGLAKVAQQANADLLGSVAKGDQVGTRVSATKIALARYKVDSLRAEADKCLGLLLHRSSETTSVEVLEPAGLPPPPEDPSLGVLRRGSAAEASALMGSGAQSPKPAASNQR